MGIDPGLKGGFVVLNMDGEITFKAVMPTITLKGKKTKNVIDLTALYTIIKEQKVDRVYLEKVASRPKQGVASVFSFGYAFGVLEMALVACQRSYVLVSPQTWCKEMHQGLSKDIDAKDRSLLIFKRLYPDLDLRATPRCTTPHSGLVDGLLLASYGRSCILKEFTLTKIRRLDQRGC